MKTWLWAGLMAAVVAVSLAPDASEAKRLGGGKSVGMQRSAPPPSAAPNAAPAKPAAPTNAAAPTAGAAPAAAAAPKRSWMGPLAGLAAGLGIAALMSHLGMGGAMAEMFGNFLMLAVVALVAVFAIRFLMQRFGRGGNAAPGGLQMAGAGNAPAANLTPNRWTPNNAAVLQRNAEPAFAPALPAAATALATAGPAVAGAAIPAGFDSEAFERIAKMIFIRLQAANDKSDLNDLRNFTTPEMFAAIRLELQERGPTTQQTDVVKVDAEVIEVTQEADKQIVSVRFHGLIREDLGGAATDFDEVWHLTKPAVADHSAWAIAGIQQRQTQ